MVINDRDPWLRHNYYHSHYEGYRGHRQPVIRDSHDERYFAGRERHWDDGRNNRYGNRREHHENHDHGRGHDHDHGRGDDHDHGRHH